MSQMFTFQTRDFIKGAVIVVLVSALTLVKSLIEAHGLHLTWSDLSNVGATSLTALIGYLLKNFLTDENDKVLGKV